MTLEERVIQALIDAEKAPDRPTLLAALRVVIGPYYDDIADPVAYVRELRGGHSTPKGGDET